MSNETELLEVLDENGVGTGMPEKRSTVHKVGLWHRAIIVAIINNKNEVLVRKRVSNKYEIKMMAEKGLFHPRTEWIKVLYNYISKF